jgi:hypothetical protein
MTQWIVNRYLGFFLDFSEFFFGGHSRQIFFLPDPETAWIVTVPHWLQWVNRSDIILFPDIVNGYRYGGQL